MKKGLFTFALTLITLCCYAQEGNNEVTIENIKFFIKDASGVLKTNGDDNYYVLNYQGKSASELYTNILSAILTIYKNPEKVLSKIENVSITISGTAMDVPVPNEADEINSMFPQENDYFAFDYNFIFQFKDGKIRVNAPSFGIENILWANVFANGRYKPVAETFLNHFGKSSDKYNICFENYINNLVVSILKKAETVNDW